MMGIRSSTDLTKAWMTLTCSSWVRRSLTGVAEDDESFDAGKAAEPRTETLDSLVVDRSVLVEGGNGGGRDAAEVEVDGVDGHYDLSRELEVVCDEGLCFALLALR